MPFEKAWPRYFQETCKLALCRRSSNEHLERTWTAKSHSPSATIGTMLVVDRGVLVCVP